jgi:hydrogenase expression/formation protein HypC
MCLAVPGRILRCYERDQTLMAEVDFGGVLKDVCLQYIPDATIGDYVIVHVGFAIQRLDEASALQTLATFESLGILEEEFGDGFDRAARQVEPVDQHDGNGALR